MILETIFNNLLSALFSQIKSGTESSDNNDSSSMLISTGDPK